MESDGFVSLPLFHEHLMVPWNSLEKGDCCGRFEAITDGFYCEICNFFVHKKCSESPEYIKHPSHSDHPLRLRSKSTDLLGVYCDLCGQKGAISYRCEICDFDIDLHCAKYPPPEVIEDSQTHCHQLTLLKEPIKFDCAAKCGKIGNYVFPYQCDECELSFHVDCVWHPSEANHTIEYTAMESDGWVSLPLFHEHSMVPWNSLEKGDCCGRFEAITDGFYCEICTFFVHQKCSESSEYIKHPSHSDHPLRLQSNPYKKFCYLCGGKTAISYNCEYCGIVIDLYCAKYPPPDVIEVSQTHRHQLTLRKEHVNFECGAKCGKFCNYEFPYKCGECESSFHVDCVWHPSEVKHTVEYMTLDVGERVSLPWIHKHFMWPWNDMRKGDCCGRFEAISDGYFCEKCDFFVHKKCGDKVPESIQHPSHSLHPLWLHITSSNCYCDLCGKTIVDLSYSCKVCDFDIDLYCVKYPTPEAIGNFEIHQHKLTLLKEYINFDCDECGKTCENEYAYECHECDLSFHVDCVWHRPEGEHPLEVNHSYHSLHPLKLHMGRLPDYSVGKCCLCGRKIDDRLFYHCSSCNFTLDMRCVLHPPPQSLVDLKAHEHKLNLVPRLDSFTCNACGVKGDGSRYACFQCCFTIHQDCLGLPRLININRHGHRVSRTSILGVVNSVCGVCRKKVDWIYGGYSCQRCPDYVVHLKCATGEDVWNGKELEGEPEEIEDIEPYVVIDDNTIQHFSHKQHYLRLNGNGLLWEENKRCSACTHAIGFQSFYGCIDCDFFLHKKCADSPKKIRHMAHNERLTLVTSDRGLFCEACDRTFSGFKYKHGKVGLDVLCSSISEPFVHPSHPHPLYCIPPNKDEICSGCNQKEAHVLRCIEDGCEFVLGFKCATLPQVVKHRVDDNPLSLCYGEEWESGKYWCVTFVRKNLIRRHGSTRVKITTLVCMQSV